MKLETIDFDKVLACNAIIQNAQVELEKIIGYKPQLLIKDEPLQRVFISNDEFVKEVKLLVAEHFDVTIKEMESKSRKGVLPDARGVAYYFIKKMRPKMAYKTIGLHFGGRDHSSVMVRIKTMLGNSRTEPDLVAKIEELNLKIEALNIYDESGATK